MAGLHMQLLQNHSNNNIQYLTMAIKAGIQFEFPCGTAFRILPGISGMIPGGIGGIEMFHNSRWDPPGIKLVSNWDPRWDWLDPASLFYLGIIAAKTSSQATGCGEKEVVHISGPKMISSPMKGKLQKQGAIIRDPTAFVSVALTEI